MKTNLYISCGADTFPPLMPCRNTDGLGWRSKKLSGEEFCTWKNSLRTWELPSTYVNIINEAHFTQNFITNSLLLLASVLDKITVSLLPVRFRRVLILIERPNIHKFLWFLVYLDKIFSRYCKQRWRLKILSQAITLLLPMCVTSRLTIYTVKQSFLALYV